MKEVIAVSFYHFSTPLIVGLPRLIKTIYSSGQNLFVVCKTNDDMNELDRVLWTFSSKEFIPHGTIEGGDVAIQPVLLSLDSSDNKNSSEILLSSAGTLENLNAARFKKYLYAFYGNSDEVEHMVNCYREYRGRDDITAIFWKQDHSGKWSNI